MSGSERRLAPPSVLTLTTAAVGVVFALPGALVLWRAFRLDVGLGDLWAEARAPLWRTVQLATLVSLTAAVLGTALAWLVVRTDLPLRRMWRLILVLPLAIPSFVGAAALIAGVAPGGVLHSVIEGVGLTPPGRLRGLGVSWLVLTAFTYPYVMLPVSARLVALRSSLDESARLLGSSPASAFVRVTLPQLRSAILGGALLVYLYCVSEFGAVQLFGYDTLTRVVYATRLVDRATSFGAAAVLLVLAIAVVAAERWQRGPAAPDSSAGTVAQRSVSLGWWAVPATVLCVVVSVVALFTPIVSLAVWAQRGLSDGRIDLTFLTGPAWNTFTVALVAALVGVIAVVPVAISTTRRQTRLGDVSAGAVTAGFALPGLVIALSLAIVTLNTPGLNRFYQTTLLLIVAYVVHFGSQALASVEQSLRAVPDQLRDAGRLLDDAPFRRFREVDLPLMRPGLAAGAGLVVLATVKELPATLLLAPIGFETLATQVWASYEEGFYAETGVASIALIAVSGLLTWSLVLRRSALIEQT